MNTEQVISMLKEGSNSEISIIEIEKDSSIYTDRWDGQLVMSGRKYYFTCWYEEKYSKPYMFSYRIYDTCNNWEKEIKL